MLFLDSFSHSYCFIKRSILHIIKVFILEYQFLTIKKFFLFLLSQRESFVTVKIFESKILINFDVFEHPESE